jgi:hypothetical protein
MKSKEANLKNFLVENLNLNKDRIHRHNGETPIHLRLMTGCGLDSFQTLKDNLNHLNLSFSQADYKYFSRTPDYGDQGLFVDFEGEKIGLQFNVQKEGRIRRKGLTPDSLGLAGVTFADAGELFDTVKENVKNTPFNDVLLSMLNSIKTGGNVLGLEKIQSQDICRITSDFGEILAAYGSLLKGNKIYFPINSNEPIADYYENEQPVSAKGRKTGGKVNLSHWKNLIDQETTTGKFLYSIADHNKNNFFKYAAELCPEIKTIANMVGGTTVADVEKFVKETDYDIFYEYIKENPNHRGLGLPDEGRPRELWGRGSTEPFYFTINTLVNRLWGERATDSISNVVSSFLQKPKFIAIDIVDFKVTTKEIEFSNISHWKTAYWSRATKAWHNWMAVEPIKGMKAND